MEKIWLLRLVTDIDDHNGYQDYENKIIGYTSKEKAINAWRKEVNEYRRNKGEDEIIIHQLTEGNAVMEDGNSNIHFWVEGLKIEE